MIRAITIFTIILMTIACSVFAFGYISDMSLPKLEIPKNATDKQVAHILDKWFGEIYAMKKINAVVLYAKKGKPILMKGYGYTSHEKKDKLTPQSSLRLASVSKQFTAASILRCQELDMLNVDQLITQFYPNFPYKEIKIRHLLNATSGIPVEYFSLADAHRSDFGDALSIQDAVQLIIDYPQKVTSQPNDKFQYLNTNYIVLAGIIEKVTLRSFEEFMQEEFFDPLQMKNTRVWNLLSKDKSYPNKATSFYINGDEYIELVPGYVDGVAGDGGIFSSVEDMMIWDEFWYGNNLISQTNLMKAFQKPTLNDGTASDYGYGWIITDHGMWHNGAWLGARSNFERNTKTKSCFAIIDNSASEAIDEIALIMSQKVLQLE